MTYSLSTDSFYGFTFKDLFIKQIFRKGWGKYNSHVIIMSNVKMNNHELKAVLETVRVL